MPEPSPAIVPRHVEEADADVFSTFYPVPGLGLVPINAFLLRAEEPVLVDTGAIVWGDAYLSALRSAIDLADLRWIYLTHADADHIGCLREVLAQAPEARLVTTFFGLGKLGLYAPLPPERVYLLNPGQSLDVGDRELRAIKPPTFDAPETTAFVDSATGALFSADCFGALLSEQVDRASDVSPSELRDGLVAWASIDTPWLASVRADRFEAAIGAVRDLAPPVVLGSHLPPALGMTERLLEHLSTARDAPPFVGPDQRELAAMLAAQPHAAE